MLFWAVDNPAPANYLLISGDRDFSNALHRLRMRRYNILLARPTQNVSAPLIGAAKSVWLWTSLARGEAALQNPLPDTEQTTKNSNSNPMVNGGRTESLEMKHSFSEPNLNHQLSQGMQSMPGAQTSDVNRHCVEPDFQEARQFQMNWSDPMPTVGCSNGQGQPGNSMHFQGTRGPTVTSEINSPSHSHANALGNPNDMSPLSFSQPFMNVRPEHVFGNPNNMRPLSFSQSFMNVRPEHAFGNSNDMRPLSSSDSYPNIRHEYDSIKQVPDPRSFLNLSMKSSSFPASPGKSCTTPGNQFQPKARPPFFPKPGPSRPPQMTGSSSIDNFLVARPNFPFDSRAGDSAQGYHNMQARYSGSSQILRQIPPDQNPPFPVNCKSDSLGAQREHSMGTVHMPPLKWLPLPEHTLPNFLDSPESRIRIVLQAIETLKHNMMVPIEENIEDCIRYGEVHIRNFNVHESLEKAIELREIVVLSPGGHFQMYLPHNTPLWKCMDPLNMHDTYPKEAWEEFHKFLSSFEGHKAMMSSQKRYHAALILKSTCLKNLVLGEIVHMLQLAINIKRWLRPHHSGWQPLSVTLLGPPKT